MKSNDSTIFMGVLRIEYDEYSEYNECTKVIILRKDEANKVSEVTFVKFTYKHQYKAASDILSVILFFWTKENCNRSFVIISW